ncbi:MAG: RidA family protein [Gammaproteobacteria bacterium]
MREILLSEQFPKPKFRYSPLVKTGPYYQTAGMIALDIETDQLIAGGVQAETSKILSNLTNALPDFDLCLKDLIIARIYTTEFDKFPLINEAWEQVFTTDITPPARSAIGVSQLPLGAKVEIEFSFYRE